uniref:Putative ovule protein n=1 Tax=Solanum chacoense TaxID=4108 RepID=A0A0V0H7C2_SOLCH
MNTSEDVDDSLAIMLDKDLNKGRGTCSKENWNMVIHRKASSNISPGSQSYSSNDLLCSNSVDAFLKDSRNDGNVMAPTLHISNPEVNKIIQECEAAMALKSNLAIKPPIVTLTYLVDEEVQVSPAILNGKLSPQALEFVPRSVIAKKNEVEALTSGVNPTNAYDIDLGDNSFDEDEEDNILHKCFDKWLGMGISHLGIKEVEVTKAKGRHMVGNTVGMVK